MKKITLILLLALLPTYNTFASQATHKLDIGISGGLGLVIFGEYNGGGVPLTIGGSIGLQSQWSIPWIAMINSINTYYMFYKNLTVSNYSLGARFFLGNPYIFFDITVGVYMNIYEHHNFEYTPGFGGALGGNIPLTEKINLQISLGIDSRVIINNIYGKFGIQFTL